MNLIVQNNCKKIDSKDKRFFSSFETVNVVSVVNDMDLYQRLFEQNSFVNYDKIHRILCDNRVEGLGISRWYNSFLDKYDYNRPGWFIFCHNDWELMEDIRPILEKLDKNCLYGPIGSRLNYFHEKMIPTIGHIGACLEKKRDGSLIREIGRKVLGKELVDTFDCQALIFHSSLLEKYHLRFDENLKWDLYVEDFCINALKQHHIKSYAINIKCCHHSDASFKETPARYYESLRYINQKYPNDIYQGTVSCIGGKKIEKASNQEIALYNLRAKLKKG